MVGLARFELTTSCTPCKRSTRLNYSPTLEFPDGRTRREKDFGAGRRVCNRDIEIRPKRSGTLQRAGTQRACYNDHFDLGTGWRLKVNHVSERSHQEPSISRIAPEAFVWSWMGKAGGSHDGGGVDESRCAGDGAPSGEEGKGHGDDDGPSVFHRG